MLSTQDIWASSMRDTTRTSMRNLNSLHVEQDTPNLSFIRVISQHISSYARHNLQMSHGNWFCRLYEGLYAIFHPNIIYCIPLECDKNIIPYLMMDMNTQYISLICVHSYLTPSNLLFTQWWTLAPSTKCMTKTLVTVIRPHDILIEALSIGLCINIEHML